MPKKAIKRKVAKRKAAKRKSTPSKPTPKILAKAPPPLEVVDSFKALKSFKAGGKTLYGFSLKAAEKHGLRGISRLPFSLRILLENLLRHEDGDAVKKQDIEAIKLWLQKKRSSQEIAFSPARVLMQDLTGVPAIADLAAMRDALHEMGREAGKVNPLVPVDLVIDHSVMVDRFGSAQALGQNIALEYKRNKERYGFLRWGSEAFDNLRVVPPGSGICHQVNLEYLAGAVLTQDVRIKDKTARLACPDTVVGMDSHTTMINGLGVLGWGVGGIEAEAAMLGQPISMKIPEVVGVRLHGSLQEGVDGNRSGASHYRNASPAWRRWSFCGILWQGLEGSSLGGQGDDLQYGAQNMARHAASFRWMRRRSPI